MTNTPFDVIIGPVCGLYVLALALEWLREPIPSGKSMAPWPGYLRASWRFNAGRRRARVIQEWPRAMLRLGWLVVRDWWSGR